MDGFFLDSLNIEGFQLNIEDLAEIHDDGFVDFLPEMCTEDLNQGDLQCGDLTVHENTCEIELNLETDVDVCSVDRR